MSALENHPKINAAIKSINAGLKLLSNNFTLCPCRTKIRYDKFLRFFNICYILTLHTYLNLSKFIQPRYMEIPNYDNNSSLKMGINTKMPHAGGHPDWKSGSHVKCDKTPSYLTTEFP